VPKYKFQAEVPTHEVLLDRPGPAVTITVPESFAEFVVEAPSLKDAIGKLESHFYGMDYLGEVA